ncbi:MAG: M15 family metallopeptidase [Pyrinomonadaceae bacterium]
MTELDIQNNNNSLLAGVNGELAKACHYMIENARGEGHILIVAEGYRTPELQDYYYAQGRTRPGPIITNARGTQGKHTQRRAVDFDFVVDGVQSNANSNPWSVIGRYAANAGLTWGGNWAMRDYRHVETPSTSYRFPESLATELPPDVFNDSGTSSNSDYLLYGMGALFLVVLLTD